MVAPEDNTIKSTGTSGTPDSKTLSEEEKKKLEEERSAKVRAERNQMLTDSISGADKKTELEQTYQEILGYKRNLNAQFNILHTEYVQPKHGEYVQSLQNRAKKGWAKLKQSDIYNASKQMLNKLAIAGRNLALTGSIGDVKLNTSITDPTRLTSYVSNQEFVYQEQNKIDSENYEVAQAEFTAADNQTDIVDRQLTSGIDAERGLVNEMRYADKMLQNNIIAQNMLS